VFVNKASNSFFGANSGQFIRNGNYNSFFGDSAGSSNTDGNNNVFSGVNAGSSNTTGSNNSFFGTGSGQTNTTGNNNTLLGSNANVASNNLTYATAIGSGATVSTSNTIALGRSDGSDKVVVYGLGAAGSTQLCRNANNEIAGCSSSLRYKMNIAPFSSGLDFIRQLRPISFDWKEGGMRDVGFGAEDVAAINPLFVTYNSKGEVEGVKYDRLTTVFVNAFKEQQQQLEAQQKQLETQQQQIEAQQKQLETQQQQIEALKSVVPSLKPEAEQNR
jgi:hypothetical protein